MYLLSRIGKYSHGSRTRYQKDHKLGCSCVKLFQTSIGLQEFQAALNILLDCICHISYFFTLIYAHVAPFPPKPQKKNYTVSIILYPLRPWGCLSISQLATGIAKPGKHF